MTAPTFPHKLIADLVVWGSAPLLAYLVRFDGRIPEAYWPGLLTLLTVGLIAKSVVMFTFHLKDQSWKHASFRDTVQVMKAVGLVGAVEVVAGLIIHTQVPLPRSTLPLLIVLGAGAMFGLRALRRAWHGYEQRRGMRPEVPPRRALIVGAGEAGSLVVREMLRHPEAGLVPTVIVDDAPPRQGLTVDGVRVVGGLDRIPDLLRLGLADQVVLAIPSADGTLVRRVNDLVLQGDSTVPVRVMPGVYELLSGNVSVSRLRDVRIEDLLRRPPVPLDLGPVRGYLEGRTVLVTGAGGSIGSELVRQLVQVGVARVIGVGRGENSIYELLRGLQREASNVEVVPVITDVRDLAGLRQVFARYRPQVVFHAAAHKHVPLMEANPEQAVLNNVIGARNVVDVAGEYGVERLVNVSTDKAVNPSSVMGASKRLVECVVKDAACDGARRTFVSVRFGNVLGSRGSVIPLFRDQIAAGGPVTVTDEQMTRYFMTIPEAVQLVLQAGALAQAGAVYFLDMGRPVRIAQLAEDMIRLSGLQPHVDVEIRYTGARPGEKLFEELTTEEEFKRPTAHPKVFMTDAPDLAGEKLERALGDLIEAAEAGESERVVRLLRGAVTFTGEVTGPSAGAVGVIRPVVLPAARRVGDGRAG